MCLWMSQVNSEKQDKFEISDVEKVLVDAIDGLQPSLIIIYWDDKFYGNYILSHFLQNFSSFYLT